MTCTWDIRECLSVAIFLTTCRYIIGHWVNRALGIGMHKEFGARSKRLRIYRLKTKKCRWGKSLVVPLTGRLLSSWLLFILPGYFQADNLPAKLVIKQCINVNSLFIFNLVFFVSLFSTPIICQAKQKSNKGKTVKET